MSKYQICVYACMHLYLKYSKKKTSKENFLKGLAIVKLRQTEVKENCRKKYCYDLGQVSNTFHPDYHSSLVTDPSVSTSVPRNQF